MKHSFIIPLLALGLALANPAFGTPSGIAFTQSADTVDVFDFIEATLTVDEPDAGNPFTDVSVSGEFAVEGGAPLKVHGFCDAADGSLFRIRFMPQQAGRHTFTVSYRQGGFERRHTGAFTAHDTARRGLLRVDSDYPEHFVWAGTGEHYYWNGTTTYYLMGWEDDKAIQQIIDRLAGHKINRLRVLVYGRNQDRPWGQPVKSTPEFKLYLNPWPAARPDDVADPGFDLRRFNVDYWQKYERMLRYARERDVVVSVIFFIGGQVLPTPFAAYSEDEQRFYRYGVARLAAFSNVTWDLGNEHNFHRETPRWCDWLGPLVKEWDPYDHLLSAHNVIYRTPGKTWNDLQLIQRWDDGQNAFMLGERAKQAATGRVIPQINEEYGYEDLWEKQPGQRAAETRRRLAWEIAMAGCYQTTGETANRGTGFSPDTGGGWVNGRGDDTMTMLHGYAHLVNFFSSFEWWRMTPHNDLVRGGAFCLAEIGKGYALYLPEGLGVFTLILPPGTYQARWFNPRSGQWSNAPDVSGPRWSGTAPSDEGDWALYLRHDPQLRDRLPPAPVSARGNRRNQVLVTFSEALHAASLQANQFSLQPPVPVFEARLADEPNLVRLTTGALAVDTEYSLSVRDLEDQAAPANRLTVPERLSFKVYDATRPIVELRFDEGRGRATANSGSSAASHAEASLIGQQLSWSTNAPPNGGSSALDWGVEPAAAAVEFSGQAPSELKGLRSFTVSGWVNCRSGKAGSGGNRIVTTINHGGDGFDLVMLTDGRLQLGVNEWPDGSPARSSAGQILIDPRTPSDNWRFFAVTYDAGQQPAEVKFYFGSPERPAALDATVRYDRGVVGHNLGPLAVGHFNSRTRPGHEDRMFRGLIDEVRVYGSQLDGTGALDLATIRELQRNSAVVSAASDYPVKPVPFTDVRLTGGLLQARQATNTAVTMPFALAQCESSKRLSNFDLAAETMQRRANGESSFQNKPPTQYPFDDSDVFKAIEGAAYCLSVRPDPNVAAQLEEIVGRIAAAQEPDGYLYTWRTMHPDSPAHDWIHPQRWLKAPQLSHELYNLGHLYEAGVAHFQATGSRSLLDVCLKSAELIDRDFGDGEPRIAPGHQVIEMGLAKLYRQTGDRRWINLAKFFLECRGEGGPYSQDHKPVVEQTEAVGHAVRANYLYSGMADVAALTGDQRYLAAIMRIWENVVSSKLHLTGGCGARAAGEAYGEAYELPNRCYNETCAAVAFLFWNHRMFLMTGDAKYMDVFERSLYNGVLSGVSLSGDRFFYPNPLEYDGKSANNHGYAGRAPWFGCACCPPNILRTIASLGGYVAAVQGEKLYLNLYADSETAATVSGRAVKLTQSTDYPWDGAVTIRVGTATPASFTLCLRIPGWIQGHPLPSDLYAYDDPVPAKWSVRVNDERFAVEPQLGYAAISRQWNNGDTVQLDLPMLVRRVSGHPRIAATRGLVALERGPVVYALEGLDNEGSVFDAILPSAAAVSVEHRKDLLGGVTVLHVAQAQKAFREENGDITTKPASLTAIPYALWANRERTPMTVWLARDTQHARVAPKPTIASQAKATVSFHRGGMDPTRLNDQVLPRNPDERSVPNFDFWPHKGTSEWAAYEFAQPVEVKGVTVSWFDDTGSGECRLPTSWRVLYRTDAGSWEPVTGAGEYLIRKRDPVSVAFDSITTRGLRLEIQLPPNFSSGLYEWELDASDAWVE